MWRNESVHGVDGDVLSAVADTSQVTIALIDRRVLDRECLARGLEASQPNLAIRAFGSVEEWFSAGTARGDISAILLSIGGQSITDPDVDDALARLVRDDHHIPTIILADAESPRHVLMALDRGARGYIPTSIGLQIAVEIVNLTRAGGIFIPASCLTASRAEIAAPRVQSETAPIDDLLTPRQVAVAEALRKGKANKIIAYELNLCESTVKVHIRNIMKKLSARNRTEVAFKINNLCYPSVTGSARAAAPSL